MITTVLKMILITVPADEIDEQVINVTKNTRINIPQNLSELRAVWQSVGVPVRNGFMTSGFF